MSLKPKERFFQIGEIVRPSGIGRTVSWTNMIGVVTEVTEGSVYVAWYGLEFEDEMLFDELASTGKFADTVPDDLRFVRAEELDGDAHRAIDVEKASDKTSSPAFS